MMVIDSRSMFFDEANKNLKHHFVQAESTSTPREFSSSGWIRHSTTTKKSSHFVGSSKL